MAAQLSARMKMFFLLAGVLLLTLMGAGGARAQSCNEDLGAMGKQRIAQVEALNVIAKSHAGKLDPIAACPHLRNIKAIEAKMLAYMLKNKDWCNIPDDFVNNFKANTVKSGTMASQACAIAEKMKQMQSQGGAAPGALPPPPKLPAGPL
jgi:hypothetical protein